VLAFVTSLRHPQNVVSPQRSSALLGAMLQSVCRQTDPDFIAVVVHNHLQVVESRDPRVVFVPVTFPPPTHAAKTTLDYPTRMLDKGAKLIAGATVVRALGASHIMFVDYDDLMHHELAEYCNAQPGSPGWYSPTGYLHSFGSRWVHPVGREFHMKCGSSTIVRTDLLEIPAHLSKRSSKEQIIESLGEDYVIGFIGDHGPRQSRLAARGHHLAPLPFGSAIYEIGTGENVSGNLVSGRQRVVIGPSIEKQYGLQRPSALSGAVAATRIAIKRVGRRLKSLTP